jgi:hypothetical protein
MRAPKSPIDNPLLSSQIPALLFSTWSRDSKIWSTQLYESHWEIDDSYLILALQTSSPDLIIFHAHVIVSVKTIEVRFEWK